MHLVVRSEEHLILFYSKVGRAVITTPEDRDSNPAISKFVNEYYSTVRKVENKEKLAENGWRRKTFCVAGNGWGC